MDLKIVPLKGRSFFNEKEKIGSSPKKVQAI